MKTEKPHVLIQIFSNFLSSGGQCPEYMRLNQWIIMHVLSSILFVHFFFSETYAAKVKKIDIVLGYNNADNHSHPFCNNLMKENN